MLAFWRCARKAGALAVRTRAPVGGRVALAAAAGRYRWVASASSKSNEYNRIQDRLDEFDNNFDPSFLQDDFGPYEDEAGEEDENGFSPKQGGQPQFARAAPSSSYVMQSHPITPAAPISTGILEPRPEADASAAPEEAAPQPLAVSKDFYIGGYNLSPESWQPTKDRDTLVEFAGAGVRRLGLVQRPKGRRNWIIIDDYGDERTVNRYAIYFQFPRPSLWKEITGEKLQEFKKKVAKIVDKRLEDVVDIQAHWKRWFETLGTHTIIPYSDITKSFYPDQTTYTPEEIYACHVFMTRNSSYFAVTPRGFKCNNPASVLFKQELEDTREEERIAIELFVAKLRYKLNSLKAQRQKEAALEHLDFKQSDDASIMKIKGRPSESESDFVSQPPAEIDLLEGIPEDLRDAAAVDEWDPENDVQFLNQIKNYALSIDGHLDATVYAQFLYPLGYGDKPADAFELMQDLGFWNKFENPHVLRWQTTPLGFSATDELEAARLIEEPPRDIDGDRRINFGDIVAFAIDPESPLDVDDAMSLYTDSKGDEWIYVHIADVARWIEPESQLDIAARSRTRTIFLPEAHYPMIPNALTQHISLRPGAGPKATISFGVRLDEAGRIDRFRIVPSIINNIITVTHEDLDAIVLENDRKQLSPTAEKLKKEHYDVLLKFVEYAKRRRSIRVDQGAVIVATPSPEVRVRYDEKEDRTIAEFKVENDYTRNAKGVVMEMMLLVGEIAANYLNERSTPVLYRTQPLSNVEQRKTAEQIISEKFLLTGKEHQRKRPNIIAQLDKAKRLGRAGIDTQPKKHWGYGLDMFVSITSPLRRYDDLVNLHQLKATLRHEMTMPYTLVQQYEIIPMCESRKEDIYGLQRDSSRFWILGYLESQWRADPARLYHAVVLHPRSDVGTGQATVFLTQLGIEADALVDRMVQRGETIQVRAEFVNPFFDKLLLKEAEPTRFLM